MSSGVVWLLRWCGYSRGVVTHVVWLLRWWCAHVPYPSRHDLGASATDIA
jgi:hypothetical protein